ncbi:hypothetical protein Spb1_24320 [Planctopirus ephydatiae]|uniref:Uncharacterized protein n=1 Tax=Planctopirus ephydatiae TaxID=2528019 RepID=A0A518GPF0_9PLAN|nr:hypothetical protein Spb1_24320 [Planctopirus ephydatiae]
MTIHYQSLIGVREHANKRHIHLTEIADTAF